MNPSIATSYDKETGLYIAYNPLTYDIYYEAQYKCNLIDGPFTEYYPSEKHEDTDKKLRDVGETNKATQKIRTETYFTKGLKNGLYKRWYPDGTLEEVATYKNGLLVGTRREYHRNGKIRLEEVIGN